MWRLSGPCLGGTIGRSAAAAASSKKPKRSRSPPKATPPKKNSTTRTTESSSAAKAKWTTPDVGTDDDVYATSRPAYMSREREQEVLASAERMQSRDLSGEVPVASFAYEILKVHPSVRSMGLRERMDFLCIRWNKLSKLKQLEYINDPLKGLL